MIVRAVCLVSVVVLAAASVHADDVPHPMSLLRRPHAGEPRMGPTGDIADLPALKPEAVWLPLELTAGARLRTRVNVNGRELRAILDTGAFRTIIMADAWKGLGLDGPTRSHGSMTLLDVNRHALRAPEVDAGDIDLGRVRVTHARAFLMPVSSREFDIALGINVLGNVDMLLAIDEGVVGIFPGGTGTLSARDNVVDLKLTDAIFAVGHLDNGGGPITFQVDTGAPTSTVQRLIAEQRKLPLDARFHGFVSGGNASREVSAGTYTVDSMRLGDKRVDVGEVHAEESATPLLGLDVLLRQRTLIAIDRRELRMMPMPVRPTLRSRGPDGAPCDGACVLARIGQDDKGSPCAELLVDKAWAGKRVSALIDVLGADGRNGLAGGYLVIEANVPVDGGALCIDPDRTLAAYHVHAGAEVSLLHFGARAIPAKPTPAAATEALQIAAASLWGPLAFIDTDDEDGDGEDDCHHDACAMFTGLSPARDAR